ncbi:MAG: Gfo/Idh/MocA family protein [bacterium]
MKNMKLALIGCGRWGKIYAKTVSRLENIEISALCTSNIENRKFVGNSCHIFSNWEDVFSINYIDALILAVPPLVQFKILAANTNIKIPVMLEKPLALSSEQSVEIESLYSKENIVSLVDHTYLFHPAYTTLKENLPSIGMIKNIVTKGGSFGPFREHTPPLWDYGPHDLSMCLDIVKEYPNHISSNRISSQIREKNLEEVWEINLKFPNGIHTKSTVGNGMKEKIRTIEINGDNGSLIFDDLDKDKLKISKNSKCTKICIPNENKLPLDIVIETFIKAVRGKQDARLGLTLGSNIVTILEKCDLKN